MQGSTAAGEVGQLKGVVAVDVEVAAHVHVLADAQADEPSTTCAEVTRKPSGARSRATVVTTLE